VLTKVDGLVVVPAVAWVLAHRLPAMAVLPAAPDGDGSVVVAIFAVVPHLLEGVDARRHAVSCLQLHVVPCALVCGIIQLFGACLLEVRVGMHVASGSNMAPVG